MQWIICGRQSRKRWLHMYLLNMIDRLIKLDELLSQKYYKGVLSPLYFPYVNHDLKTCHHVKAPYYFGLCCNKACFDEFILDTNDCHEKWEKNDGKWSLYKSVRSYLEK